MKSFIRDGFKNSIRQARWELSDIASRELQAGSPTEITSGLTFRQALKLGLWLAACWLALFGCRPVAPRIELPPVAEKTLLGQLAVNKDAFHSLQGMADIRADIEGKTNKARQVVLLEKPDQLRTDILGLFGQPVLRVAVSQNLLTVYIPSDQLFLQGPATAENLSRFTLLPLGVEELVRLALYDVPLIPYIDSSLEVLDNRYILRLKDSRGDSQILQFDGYLRLVGVEYFRDDELLLRVGYDRFKEEPNSFPGSVSLFMPRRQASLTIVFSDLELNKEIPVGRFRLEPPAGSKVRRLSGGKAG
jgi:hypothetical protein